MDEAKFWSLIEAAGKSSDDPDEQLEMLVQRLTKRPTPEILEFDRILRDMVGRSYTNDLWAACYILNGGCSDDSFDYFRGWLIMQGNEVFYNALRDAESLADLDLPTDEEFEFESLFYAGVTAYEEKTGKEFPQKLRGFQYDLTGGEWTEDDVYEKYPRLAAKVDPLA